MPGDSSPSLDLDRDHRLIVDTSDRVFDDSGALDDGVVLGRLDLLADQVVGFARATARSELHAVAL